MPIMLKADSSSPNKLFSIISGLAEPLSESHEPTRAESQKSKLCHRLAGHSCGYDTLDEQKFMTPVQEMSTMLPHNSLLESDTNNTTMIPEEVAEVLLDEKAVPSVVKEQDDWTSLGEISLNPDSHASPKDEETPVENKLELVDPWTQVDVTTKSPEEETVKASFVERWTSFRNRWNSNPLEDEQATAVIKEEATPPSPEISSLSPQTQSQLQSEEATPTRKGFSFFKSKSTPTVDPTNLSAQEMASFRASKISVTVQKESRDSKWGFGMDQKGSRVQIKVMTGTGLLEHAPFQVGDYLVSVNNQKCTRAETTIQELVKIDAEFPITLMVETPEGNPNLVQAMVRKPSPNANLGVGFYIPSEVVEPKQGESEPIVNPESPVTSELTEDKENETAAVIAPASDDPANRLLRINNIDPHGLLSHSALSQGDIVLAINATPCSQMTPAEAEVLLHQSDNSVTIIAMKPPSQTSTRTQGWLRHAKRAGVAIGGGTLVGVGLIFIPTLPPPFGEVLIVGGVSVLGTEFEGPKRVMRSARDSLERAVGRELERDKPAEEDDTLTTSEAESTGSPDSLETDKPQTPKTTIGDRFKNFGRRHVLPFLDQVVGDRTEVKEENPTTNDENMGDEAKVDEPNDTTVTSPETSLQESPSAEGVVGEEHISL